MSFLAGLASVPHPWNLIAGGIIALGLTISYILREFDIAIKECKNGKEPFFQRLQENKFIYFVRFTTVMGACMLLYAGIDVNYRNQAGRSKAIALVKEEIERRKVQEQNLLEQSHSFSGSLQNCR